MGLFSWFGNLFGGGAADDHEPPRRRKRKKKKRSKPDDEGPKDSLVLLVKELPYLDDAVLRRATEKVLDVELGEGGPDATDFVMFNPPMGFIQAGGWSVMVNVFDMPYSQDVDAAAEGIPELRRRELFRQHTAWMSCDVMLAPDGATADEKLAIAGRLLAELAPDDGLLLYHPETAQGVPYTPEVEQLLAAGKPREIFAATATVPISGIDGDDPRMVAAVAEAKQRFPEFVAALAKRKSGDTFAVKVPFSDSDFDDPDARLEFMWITVSKVDDTHIHGRLDNDPAFTKSVRVGQMVRVPRSRLNDWLYTRGDDSQGGFTIKILMDQLGNGEE